MVTFTEKGFLGMRACSNQEAVSKPLEFQPQVQTDDVTIKSHRLTASSMFLKLPGIVDLKNEPKDLENIKIPHSNLFSTPGKPIGNL